MNKKANNVLIMGETGVGKSVIVKDYLNNLSPEEFVSMGYNFSAQTSSNNVMDIFFDKLMQRGRDLGAPSGKKMVFFVDDINMPKLDTYGAQPPNEFLRQVIDQGGFYD
jgi:dynein heavy chain